MILSTLERRWSLENPNVPIAEGYTMFELFGGQRTYTDRVITAEAALSFSAVWAAVNRIAGTAGSLPVKLYRRNDGGGKEEERGHWAWEFVTQGPSPYLKASGFKEAAQGHLLLRGNAYCELMRERSRSEPPVGKLHHPDKAEVKLTKSGEPFFVFYEEENGKPRPVPFDEVLHIAGPGGNGITGWSVLKNARESIALGLGAEEYAARYYANNARPSGILSAPEVLKPETRENIRKSWTATQGGLDNAHKVAVLEGGVTWQQMSLSAEDSQFLESRQHQVRDVARWFLIPPHMIGDLDDATFSNIAEQQIQYMTDTMEPWLIRWEAGLNARLLTSDERRAGLFFEFVRDARLSGDPEKRGNFYTAQANVGAITPNEIRAKENRNPVPGGDRAFVRLDMIPLEDAGQMQPAERARLLLASQGVVTPEPETRATEKKEIHSYQARYRLRASSLASFLDAADRLVRGEIRDVKRNLAKVGTPSFLEWLNDYYFNDYPDFAARTMGPVMDSYGQEVAIRAAEEIGLEAPTNDVGQFVALYTETFAARQASQSRRALTDLDERGQIEARLAEWNEGGAESAPMHERIAKREVVGLGEAISKAVWVAGGILVLRWIAVGDTCPYCRRMDGRTVGVSEFFVKGGESFAGEGTDVPLSPASNVGHPPLHRGCDCVVVPAL